MPLSRPSFPCWEGQDKAVWLKKPIRLRNKVHLSTNNPLFYHQHNCCWCFLVSAQRNDPNFCTQMLQNKGGRQGEGLICCVPAPSKGWQGLQAGLQAQVHKVRKLEHIMICLRGCLQTQTYDMFVCVCAHACVVALIACCHPRHDGQVSSPLLR